MSSVHPSVPLKCADLLNQGTRVNLGTLLLHLIWSNIIEQNLDKMEKLRQNKDDLTSLSTQRQKQFFVRCKLFDVGADACPGLFVFRI